MEEKRFGVIAIANFDKVICFFSALSYVEITPVAIHEAC
jgi:hypothetical protein